MRVLNLKGFVAGFAGFPAADADLLDDPQPLEFSPQTVPEELHEAGW